MIYGDDKTGGATGIVGPPPFMNYTDYKGFAIGQAGFSKTFAVPTW